MTKMRMNFDINFNIDTIIILSLVISAYFHKNDRRESERT